jgi:hypothetical protein
MDFTDALPMCLNVWIKTCRPQTDYFVQRQNVVTELAKELGFQPASQLRSQLTVAFKAVNCMERYL